MSKFQRSYIFSVDQAVYETKKLTTDNHIRGPGYRSWSTGSSLLVHLDVTSASNIPIKKLEFDKFCTIQAGDTIRATIDQEEKQEYKVYRPDSSPKFRELQETEKPLSLEKLSKTGEVLATFK